MLGSTLTTCLLGVLTFISTIQSATGQTDLYITGIIDGTVAGETPRAIEFYAAASIANLGQYYISTVFGIFSFPNGRSVSAGTYIYVTTPGSAVPASSAFYDFFLFDQDYTTDVANNQGSWAVYLFNVDVNGSVDRFGENGRAGGTPWDYNDGWAYRKSGRVATTTFSVDDWIFSGVGALTGVTTNTAALKPFPAKKYTPSVGGGGGGDPHFATWDGMDYSYHGACDLVMLHSPGFGDGTGLTVHIRTEIVDNWSRIANTAIKIGSDILEVLVDGTHFFNGVYGTVDDAPSHIAQFPLSARRTCQGDNLIEDSCKTYKHHYEIDLGDGTRVETISYSGFLNFNVKALVDHFAGMIGTSGTTGLVARDGETVLKDPNQMGAEWQVRDDEPMLFHDIRAPQYPVQCILPAANAKKSIIDTIIMGTGEWKKNRHLRQGFSLIDKAEAACAGVHDLKACMTDVITMGDTDLALLYMEEEK